MDNNYAFLSDYLNRVAVESSKVDQQTPIEDNNNDFFNTFDEADQQEEPGIQYGFSDPSEEDQEEEQVTQLEDQADDEDQDFMDATFDTPDYEMGQSEGEMGQFADNFDNETTGPGTGPGGGSVGERIASTESEGNYKATNKHSSATGKYQFLWGDWGDSIKKVTGVKSKQEFLNNPKAQDKYYAWYEKHYLAPEVKKLQAYNKNGLSDEQLMRLVHFRGAGGAKKYLQGKLKDKPESYNVPISEYIGKKKVGGYQTGGKVKFSNINKDLELNLSNYRDDVVNFFNQYLDSPNYTKRLLKQGYSDPEAAIQLRKANLAVTKMKKDVAKGSEYDTKTQQVNVDPAQFVQHPDFTIPSVFGHEFSHVVGAHHPLNTKIPFPMKMTDNEINEFEKRNKLSKIKEAPADMIGKILHDKLGNESKADLDALRYMLYKDKIYDTGTQNFDKNILNKAKKRYSKDFNAKRLFKNFSDSDLIYLMNNIAINEQNNLNNQVAQFGGLSIAKTSEEQYDGLNNPDYDEMIFPLYGDNEFRGLDNGEPVFLQDETGKKKVLKGRKDTAKMTGKVFEKRIK